VEKRIEHTRSPGTSIPGVARAWHLPLVRAWRISGCCWLLVAVKAHWAGWIALFQGRPAAPELQLCDLGELTPPRYDPKLPLAGLQNRTTRVQVEPPHLAPLRRKLISHDNQNLIWGNPP